MSCHPPFRYKLTSRGGAVKGASAIFKFSLTAQPSPPPDHPPTQTGPLFQSQAIEETLQKRYVCPQTQLKVQEAQKVRKVRKVQKVQKVQRAHVLADVSALAGHEHPEMIDDSKLMTLHHYGHVYQSQTSMSGLLLACSDSSAPILNELKKSFYRISPYG